MKKTILSIILSLIVATVAAQTNQYPNTSGTITLPGYTYVYSSDEDPETGYVSAFVDLRNASASYYNVEYGNKDGSPLTRMELAVGSRAPLYSSQSMTDEELLAMVHGVFSSQQRTTLKGHSIIIGLRIDSSTGKVADVYFHFFRNKPAANIPVETYRAIELAIKQKFTVTLTAEGRKKNYLQLSWIQEF